MLVLWTESSIPHSEKPFLRLSTFPGNLVVESETGSVDENKVSYIKSRTHLDSTHVAIHLSHDASTMCDAVPSYY